MPLKFCRRIFLIAAVIGVPLRIYLHLFHIDPETGFYEGGAVLVVLYNVLMLAAVAAMIFFGLRMRIEKPVIVTSPFLRVAAVAGGLGAMLLAIPDAQRLAGPDYMPNTTLIKILQLLALTVFPLIAAGTLFYVGLKSKTELVHVNGYLSIIIDLWMVFFLMSRFMEYTASRHVSDQMLVIVALALGALLLIPLGRFLAGLTLRRATSQMMAFGLSFALLVFTVMPGILLTLHRGETLALTGSESIAVLFLGIYVVAMCFSLREEA